MKKSVSRSLIGFGTISALVPGILTMNSILTNVPSESLSLETLEELKPPALDTPEMTPESKKEAEEEKEEEKDKGDEEEEGEEKLEEKQEESKEEQTTAGEAKNTIQKIQKGFFDFSKFFSGFQEKVKEFSEKVKG